MTEEQNILEEKVREALREVLDPELGLSVVELGLIRKIDIKKDSVDVTMILTTPFCPYGPRLMETVRKAAEEAAQVPATTTPGMELWDPSMMEEGAGADWGLF